MKELHCDKGHLLARVFGRDYRIELFCRKCRQRLVFQSDAPPAISRLEEVVLNSPVSVRASKDGGKPRVPRVPAAEGISHG